MTTFNDRLSHVRKKRKEREEKEKRKRTDSRRREIKMELHMDSKKVIEIDGTDRNNLINTTHLKSH